jgi:hypothetical protein
MLTMQLDGAATWFDIPFKYFEGERPANIWVMFDIGWMYLSGDTNPLQGNTWYQLSNGGPSTYYYRTAAEELSFNAYWTDNPAQGPGRQALYQSQRAIGSWERWPCGHQSRPQTFKRYRAHGGRGPLFCW